MTPFDKWLAALAAAGKGPVTLYCDRGVDFEKQIAIQSDLTGATLRGEVRVNPDATGSALATFDVSAVSVVAGVSTFTLGLTQTEVNALPASATGEGVVHLPFDLLITLSGGAEQRLFGGTFEVSGQVTV